MKFWYIWNMRLLSHNMLNGYPTHMVGELETAAWEMASGGCGLHVAYWIDRLLVLPIAFMIAPRRSLCAWRSGWQQRNLYRLDPARLLAMDLDEVRRHIAR